MTTDDQHMTERAAPAPAHTEYHPSAREYVRVGLILVALTCLEVWLSYSDLAGRQAHHRAADLHGRSSS